MPPRHAVGKFGCIHGDMFCGLASRVREKYECALPLKESVFPGAGLGISTGRYIPSRDDTHCNAHNIQQGVTLFKNTGAHCGPNKHIRFYNGSILCGECFKDTYRAVPRNAGTYNHQVFLSHNVLATSRQAPNHLSPFLYSYAVALEDLDGYDLDGSPGVMSAKVFADMGFARYCST